MLEAVIFLLTSLLLLTGCYTDLKYFHVSNNVTYAIALLSIPLITLSNQLLYAQIGFSLFLLAAWYFNQIGAADVKVLIPILFTLNDFYFLAFLSTMCISGMVMFMSYKKAIPAFVSITTAYILITVFKIAVAP